MKLAVFVNVLSGFIVLVLVFLLGRASHYLRLWSGLRYLRTWLGGQEVIIVLPNFSQYYGTHEFLSALPPNVQMMPAAEGGALVELIRALETARRHIRVHFASDTYPSNPDHLPVISIGGPSVNSVSAELVKHDHPGFQIEYPAHIATVGHTTYRPRCNERRETVEDWGFILTGTAHGSPYIVLCGVYSQGTWAAVLTATTLQRRSDRQLFARRRRGILVSHTDVGGFQIDHSDVCLVQPQPLVY